MHSEATVTCSLAVSWDDQLTEYDFGPGHPLAPVRVELAMALAREFGVLDTTGVSVSVPEPATGEQLELVHDPAYIDAVRRAGSGRRGASRWTRNRCSSAWVPPTIRSSPACMRRRRW